MQPWKASGCAGPLRLKYPFKPESFLKQPVPVAALLLRELLSPAGDQIGTEIAASVVCLPLWPPSPVVSGFLFGNKHPAAVGVAIVLCGIQQENLLLSSSLSTPPPLGLRALGVGRMHLGDGALPVLHGEALSVAEEISIQGLTDRENPLRSTLPSPPPSHPRLCPNSVQWHGKAAEREGGDAPARRRKRRVGPARTWGKMGSCLC